MVVALEEEPLVFAEEVLALPQSAQESVLLLAAFFLVVEELEEEPSHSPQLAAVVAGSLAVLVLAASHSPQAVSDLYGQLVAVGAQEVMVLSAVEVTVVVPAAAMATRPAIARVVRILNSGEINRS